MKSKRVGIKGQSVRKSSVTSEDDGEMSGSTYPHKVPWQSLFLRKSAVAVFYKKQMHVKNTVLCGQKRKEQILTTLQTQPLVLGNEKPIKHQMSKYRDRIPHLYAKGDPIYFKNFWGNFPEILESAGFPNTLR